MKKLSSTIILLAVLVVATCSAYAIPVRYTFESNNPYFDISFEYLTPDGFVTPEVDHNGDPSWGPVQIPKSQLISYNYPFYSNYFYGISFASNFVNDPTQYNFIAFINGYEERFFYFPLESFNNYGVYTGLMGPYTLTVAAETPEPSTFMLLGAGVIGAVLLRRR